MLDTGLAEWDARRILRSPFPDEGEALNLREPLQLEVARVPARTSLVSVVQEEEGSPHHWNEVQRQGQCVPQHTLLREHL